MGSGDVGHAIGTGFVKLRHEVKMGSRNPEKKEVVDWTEAMGDLASSGTFAEAAKFGELIVVSTLWTGTENAIKMAGPENFSGKVVIDTTNPLDFSKGMPPSLILGHNDSAGETVQRWLPDAKVVKAFNIIGNAHMFKPDFPGGPPDMFICGNDEAAKKAVTEVLNEFGWPNVTDMGNIEFARILEPLCILWVTYGAKTGSWNHALKMLKK